MSCTLGVDIGGTKIQFCRIGRDLSVVALDRVSTGLLRRGTTRFADDLLSLVRAKMPRSADSVAVSLNGIVDQGHIPYSSLMGGRVAFPLQAFLRDGLGVPVHVDDDIHAMTLAEFVLGGHPPEPMAMLNLGTGIGVGCHDGHGVLRGRYGAGLISELKIYVKELDEFRSLDRTVCGRGLRELYAALSGLDADAVNIFARARERDPAAMSAVEIFTKGLGHVLQMISRFYHPARIVVNGSIKKAAADYFDNAAEIYTTGLESAFRAEVMISKLDHAAELGTLLGANKD
jgi:predicted NBD/HSP70 family sugar kinase